MSLRSNALISQNPYLTEPQKSFELMAGVVGLHETRPGPAAQTLFELEKFVQKDFIEFSRLGAPPNSAELIAMLELQLERLRDFIEFPEIATRRIVALGGAFSAGKSSVINAMFETTVLPTALRPTTSVPTYVIQSPNKGVGVWAINAFDRRVDLNEDALKAITHDFLERHGLGFGHLLQAVFVQLPGQLFPQLAFLDTPGYSKADATTYAHNTDEHVARKQLREADYIMWLVDAEAGTVSHSDLHFLQSLQSKAPLLVLFNKADKKNAHDIPKIIAQARRDLAEAGLTVADVLPISALEPETFPLTPVHEILRQWNEQAFVLPFARNFLSVFMAYEQYFQDLQRLEKRRITPINRAALLVDSEHIEVARGMRALQYESRTTILELEQRLDQLAVLKGRCFKLLAEASAHMGVDMPAPDHIDVSDFHQPSLRVARELRAAMAAEQEGISYSLIGATLEELPLEAIRYLPLAQGKLKRAHPASALDWGVRMAYITVLGLAATVDSPLTAEETTCLLKLGTMLKLGDSEAALETVLFQAKQTPPTPVLGRALEQLRDSELRFSLLLDMMLIILANGQLHRLEQAFASELMEAMRATDGQVEWLTRLAYALASGDAALLAACHQSTLRVQVPREALAHHIDAPKRDVKTYGAQRVTKNEKLTIDHDARLIGEIVVEAEGELRIVGAQVDFEEQGRILSFGRVTIADAVLTQAPQARGTEFFMITRDFEALQVSRTRIEGRTRPAFKIVPHSGKVEIEGVTFVHCHNQKDHGGAVNLAVQSYAANEPFQIRLLNCRFEQCESQFGGGGLHLGLSLTGLGESALESTMRKIVVRGCTFDRCKAPTGSAIRAVSNYGVTPLLKPFNPRFDITLEHCSIN
ncbi:GTPase Era [compost metagenome]